jgi:DNA segregation ATPase FtsK/SpoIIIE-like protein
MPENEKLDKIQETLEAILWQLSELNKYHKNIILDDRDDNEIYNEAKKIVVEADAASASLLQRRLKIGYAAAARILDRLEDDGIVGPADGAKPRKVT